MKTLLPILKTKLFVLGFISACTVILATTIPQVRNFIAPQKAIGEKITTEQKKIAPKIKTQNKTVSSSRVTSGVALEMNNSFTATVVSDQPDYAPLSTATFTGDGFAPNEEVVLKVKNLNQPCNTVTADSSYLPWTVTTDNDGHFVTTWTVCNCPGDSLRLKAVGQTSGDTAYAFFTDSSPWTAVVSPTSACANTPTTFTFTITSGGGGNSGIGCVKVTVPSAFGSLGTPVVTAAPTGVGNWTIGLSGGVITATANGNGDRLGNGQQLVFTIQATPTTATGSPFTWTTSGTENTNCILSTNPNPTTQPSVSVGNPPNNTTTGFTGNTACPGAGGQLTYDAIDATFSTASTYTIKFTDAASNTYTQIIPTASPYTFNVTPSPVTTTTYTLISIDNSTCVRTSGFGDATAQITVSDNTPPSITATGTTLTLGCNPSASDINAALGSASATDNCGTPTVTQSDGTATGTCSRSQTRTFTARDASGNTATTSRTVTWSADNTPPTLTSGGTTLTLGCNPSVADINGALGTATATDACGTPTVSSADGSVGSSGCSRSQTRTFTAIDACNNTSTTARTVTWTIDATPPTITTGGNSTPLGCNPDASDINAALGTATASDACGPVTITSSDGSVTSGGCQRSQVRTWTARDACGNTSTASRSTSWIEDNSGPTITTGGTGTSLGCNPSAGDINAALGTATATDNCLGIPTITTNDGAVQSSGCARSQTRTFTAEDGCGNTSTASRTVTWTADVTPPVFTGTYVTLPLGCNPAAGDVTTALGAATATDFCGSPVVTSSDGPLVSNGCNRSQTRTFTATDGCTNTATTSRTVTWTEDNTPPVFTGTYTTVPLGCNPNASDITAALGTATATDFCGNPAISSSDGTVVSNGCNRSQTRTFTATDGCTNTATTARTVTWTADVTPPVFTGTYTTVPLGCNPDASDITAALGAATATDFCGNPVISSSDGSVVSTGCNRSQTRIFTATDGCTNTATIARTVTWTDDVTPPVFTGNYVTLPLGCNPAASDIAGALGGATATDFCGSPVITSSDGPQVSNGCNRSQTRTFTATDGCTNTATTSRTVTWTEDVTPPVFTGIYGTAVLGCNPDGGTITSALGNATATDFCGNPIITFTDGTIYSNGCDRIQTRTFTATDGCSNTATISRTATWTADNTPPTLTSGGTTTILGCNPSAADINGALGTATATDACGVPTVTSKRWPCHNRQLYPFPNTDVYCPGCMWQYINCTKNNNVDV